MPLNKLLVAEIGSLTINFPYGISIPFNSLDPLMKRELQEHSSFEGLCRSNDDPDLKVYVRIFYFAYTVAFKSPIACCAGMKTEASWLVKYYYDAVERDLTVPFGRNNSSWLLEVLNFWIALKED